MTAFAAILLTVLAFVFIAYPLFKRRVPSADVLEDEKLRELSSKRDTTYAMLKELEFDFQSGVLIEEDYRELEARYEKKAMSILRDIDGLGSGTEVAEESEMDEEIEKQVRELRQAKSSQVDDELEKEILELRQDKGRFCTQCGARHQEGDRFCSRCGAKLSREDTN